ncbi:MAG: citrate synthase [Candidatus Sungbacteria bacterium]|nr:citrate synthase [Candidatus Sungbacteria bacterium]
MMLLGLLKMERVMNIIHPAENDKVIDPGLRHTGYAPTGKCLMRDGKLYYCGYDVADLTAHSSFEECAYLLLHGELPNEKELCGFLAQLRGLTITRLNGFIPPRRNCGEFRRLLTLFGPSWMHTNTMDTLRTMVSFLGTDAFKEPATDNLILHNALTLMATMPLFVAAIAHHKKYGNLRKFPWHITPPKPYSVAKMFLTLLHGQEPPEEEWKALDASLILYLEHEDNASTHTAHVVTGTNSDIFSANIAGLCALKGNLHGGANEYAMELLEEIGDASRAREVLEKKLAAGELIMGFGHAVYKNIPDPRCTVMKPIVERLAQTHAQKNLYELALGVEEQVFKLLGKSPNIDFWTAPLYKFLGIPAKLATPVFTMSRTVGWSAHHMEYRKLTADKRGMPELIRPRSSEYVGPEPRSYIPISQRS